MPFSSLGLSPDLLKTIQKLEYTEAYPIQKEAIPAILAKKDVLAIAQTGSGKTECFLLPVIADLVNESKKWNNNRKKRTLNIFNDFFFIHTIPSFFL